MQFEYSAIQIRRDCIRRSEWCKGVQWSRYGIGKFLREPNAEDTITNGDYAFRDMAIGGSLAACLPRVKASDHSLEKLPIQVRRLDAADLSERANPRDICPSSGGLPKRILARLNRSIVWMNSGMECWAGNTE